MTITDVRYAITASSPNGEQPTLEMELGPGSHFGPVVPPPLVQQPINLVRSSRNPSGEGDGWTNGFSYLPLGRGAIKLHSDCSPDTIDVPVAPGTAVTDWQPYVLSAEFECSMMGFDEQDYTARAKGLLDVATPKMIEYEFWNGSLAQAAGWSNLYLKQAGVQTYAATTMMQAIAICEQFISAIGAGGRGMIHTPAYLTPYLQLICRREGNLLLTYRDTIVVPGGGYANGGGAGPPVLPPAGAIPMFATGITDCRVGDIIPVPESGSFYQAIDRKTNSVLVKAERMACASWDGVVFCRVDLTLPA